MSDIETATAEAIRLQMTISQVRAMADADVARMCGVEPFDRINARGETIRDCLPQTFTPGAVRNGVAEAMAYLVEANVRDVAVAAASSVVASLDPTLTVKDVIIEPA